MKNLELLSFGVDELSTNEMLEVVGGGWWSEFRSGFMEGLAFCKEALEAIRDALR